MLESLREKLIAKLAKYICDTHSQTFSDHDDVFLADQILSLISEELDKLTVVEYDEISEAVYGNGYKGANMGINKFRKVAKAQLSHTREELKGLLK